MTPSLKLRRRQIVERFVETISDLYGDEEHVAADESGGAMARVARGA